MATSFWESWKSFWRQVMCLGGHFWFKVGSFGAHFGSQLTIFAGILAPTRGVGGLLGPKLGVFGSILIPSWQVLGAILAPSWKSWGPFWLQVGSSGDHFGSKLAVLGAILAPSRGSWGSFWLQVGRLGGHLASKSRGRRPPGLQIEGLWPHFGSKLVILGVRSIGGGDFEGTLAPSSTSWVPSCLQVGILGPILAPN